jgi:tRNA (cmo5U34)-methyltransferase
MSEPEKFSFDTIQNFDEHIDLSIPNYSFVAKQVSQYSEYFARDYTSVVDLGCSTGKLLMEMNHREKASYYGYDISSNLLPRGSHKPIFIKGDLVQISENTLEVAEELRNPKVRTPVEVYSRQSASGLSTFPKDISFAYSLFTLQFLPPIKRKTVITAINEQMVPGGAFVSCEKIYSKNAKLQDMTNSIYYEFKNQSFESDKILSKERDLRSLHTLQTLEESISDLSVIGTPNIFWMSYNFVGIIVIKDK